MCWVGAKSRNTANEFSFSVSAICTTKPIHLTSNTAKGEQWSTWSIRFQSKHKSVLGQQFSTKLSIKRLCKPKWELFRSFQNKCQSEQQWNDAKTFNFHIRIMFNLFLFIIFFRFFSLHFYWTKWKSKRFILERDLNLSDGFRFTWIFFQFTFFILLLFSPFWIQFCVLRWMIACLAKQGAWE